MQEQVLALMVACSCMLGQLGNPLQAQPRGRSLG